MKVYLLQAVKLEPLCEAGLFFLVKAEIPRKSICQSHRSTEQIARCIGLWLAESDWALAVHASGVAVIGGHLITILTPPPPRKWVIWSRHLPASPPISRAATGENPELVVAFARTLSSADGKAWSSPLTFFGRPLLGR